MSQVDPERLLKDLRNLWLDLGKEAPDGVLRACAMTFIVVADERRDAFLISETIAGLMHDHPSRAIVVRVRECLGRVLEARVFAQCWMPFGRRQQICCEQVEIIASPGSLADVATVIRALVVPDLPVILYSPSENLWWLPQFQALLPATGKVILDSCGMEQPARVLDLMTSMPARRKADLVWSRLTPWREAVAQIFENPEHAKTVYDLAEVHLMFQGTEEPSAVIYLAGWFTRALGRRVPLRLSQGAGAEYAGVTGIRLSGPGLAAEISMIERCTAETRITGEPSRVVVFPVANEDWALRQELALGARDKVFEEVVGLAHQTKGAA